MLTTLGAVELAHAYVQCVVENAGARALLIKGPTLTHQGLRRARTSSDVDVLIEPREFEAVCTALLTFGWHERPVSLIAEVTSVHSRTFLHDAWPCDIDVHRYFPGMLADPSEAFEALWAEKTQLTFASQRCDVPNRIGNVIILALHSLRGTERQGRHAEELDHLIRVPLTLIERNALSQLATATGSAATLIDVLPRLGVDVAVSTEDLKSAPARRWRERVSSGSFGAYFWLAALREAQGVERARIAWRAVWPSNRDLLIERPETRDTPVGRVHARVRRWRRGARSIPRALRVVWQHR